jgi:hypothetical protein
MPNFLESTFLPQTANLRAMAQAVDESMPELERLQGMAVQEGNENLQRRRREAMKIAGEEGWTSTQMRDYMGRMEQENLAFQNSASADTMQQRAAARQARRQLELMAAVKGPQEASEPLRNMMANVSNLGGLLGDQAAGAADSTGSGQDATSLAGEQPADRKAMLLRYLAMSQGILT